MSWCAKQYGKLKNGKKNKKKKKLRGIGTGIC